MDTVQGASCTGQNQFVQEFCRFVVWSVLPDCVEEPIPNWYYSNAPRGASNRDRKIPVWVLVFILYYTVWR